MRRVVRFSHIASASLALILALAPCLSAQVKYDGFTATMEGTVQPGYSATYGNTVGSTHSWLVGGNGTLNGSYYSPNFLSFTVSPYVSESTANSNFRSTSKTSGVNAMANFFGGSHFPGSFSYSRSYDAEGTYHLPGVSNYTTHGNGSGIGLSWSEAIPDAPTLNFNYQKSSSDYSVYGSNSNGNNRFHSFGLTSSYRLDGFQVGANYTNGASNTLIPSVVTGQNNSQSQSSNNSYGFNVSHRLPVRGTANVSVNRSSWDTSYLNFHNTGSLDLVNAAVAIHPTQRINITSNLTYSDNLAGQLLQQQSSSNTVADSDIFSQSSDSFDVTSQANYAAEKDFNTSLFVEHRSQHYSGHAYAQDSVGAGAGFSHKLFEGTFTSATFASGNVSENNGDGSLSLTTNENYSASIRNWDVNATFGYSQDMQTQLITYTTSSFNYGVNARHRLGNFLVALGAVASHSGLTQTKDSSNSSQGYFGNLGYRNWFTASGSYSKASGQALLTGGGLVPIPNPIPSSLIGLFGGHSYSASLSSSPRKGLVFSASYSNSKTNNTINSTTTANKTSEFSSLVQYQYRKLYFLSGFSRLDQSFSSAGTKPETLSSFYIGVSRWFKLF